MAFGSHTRLDVRRPRHQHQHQHHSSSSFCSPSATAAAVFVALAFGRRLDGLFHARHPRGFLPLPALHTPPIAIPQLCLPPFLHLSTSGRDSSIMNNTERGIAPNTLLPALSLYRRPTEIQLGGLTAEIRYGTTMFLIQGSSELG